MDKKGGKCIERVIMHYMWYTDHKEDNGLLLIPRMVDIERWLNKNGFIIIREGRDDDNK